MTLPPVQWNPRYWVRHNQVGAVIVTILGLVNLALYFL